MSRIQLRKIKREMVKFLSGVGLRSVRTVYMGMPLRVPVVHGVVPRGLMVADEFWMSDCLHAFIATSDGAVIDIGVNVGLYLTKLRVISSNRPYTGFEPNPSCLLYVQELIRLNDLASCRVFPLALFDQVCVTRFYAGWHGDKTGTLIREFREGDSTDFSFDVLTAVGDEVISLVAPGELCVIKIDVEEAELHVLKGLRATIAERRPYIYCEMLHAGGDAAKAKKGRDVYEFVTKMNYSVLGLNLLVNELQEIRDFAEIGSAFKEEYIFCPADRLADFCSAIKNNSSGVIVRS